MTAPAVALSKVVTQKLVNVFLFVAITQLLAMKNASLELIHAPMAMHVANANVFLDANMIVIAMMAMPAPMTFASLDHVLIQTMIRAVIVIRSVKMSNQSAVFVEVVPNAFNALAILCHYLAHHDSAALLLLLFTIM